MNSKAKMKKNMVRLVALLLAAMTVIGLVATTTNTAELTGRGYNYSAGLTKDGYFKNVTATEVITLPDYSKFEMPKAMTETTDDVVQAEINSVLSAYGEEEKDTDAERLSALGDKVNINYVGSVDGVEFEGGKADNFDLTLGSGTFIPGFEDAVVGHKVGENFDINVTFPEDYGAEGTEKAELNGKAAVFNITINHMYKTILPEFNDKFVEENYSDFYSSAQEMEDDYRKLIIEDQMKLYAQTLLMEDCEVDIYPQEIIDFVEGYMVANMEAQGAQYGFTAESMVGLYGYETVEEYLEANKESIEAVSKSYLVYQAYAEKEGLTVSDEYLNNYCKEAFGEQDYSDIIAYYGKPYMKFTLMANLILDDLTSKMPVKDIPVPSQTETPAE